MQTRRRAPNTSEQPVDKAPNGVSHKDDDHSIPIKPSQRGVLHTYAAVVAPIAGILLTLEAPKGGRERLGLLLYTLALTAQFVASAVYHRPTWDPERRKIMKAIDHAAIYLLIAGTYTPVCMLGLDQEVGMMLLKRVWAGAFAGIIKSLAFPKAPKIISAAVYISLGVAAVPYWAETKAALGVTCSSLVALGGVLFIVGAICYAAQYPNPIPGHFGYHEIFHALVIAAATLHYIAIWRLVHGLHAV